MKEDFSSHSLRCLPPTGSCELKEAGELEEGQGEEEVLLGELEELEELGSWRRLVDTFFFSFCSFF